jgi:uncharacterized repeat protein (TIGR01451 family)
MEGKTYVSIGANNRGRTRQLMMLALFALSVCWFCAVGFTQAHAQAAPANSTIGNQASATYFDTAAPLVQLTSSSNTVVTTVSQVYNFTLTANGAQTKPANQQVCYPHTITNIGNGFDTFTLNTPTTGGAFAHTALAYYSDVAPVDGQPDTGTPIISTGAIAAGGTFTFVVCGTTAAAATAGQTGTIIISATSSAPMMPPTQTNTDTTTIGNCSIALTKTLSSTTPPGVTPVTGGLSPNAGPLYVILGYTNSGSVACNNVIIADPLPSGFLYRTGTGRWSNSGMTALTDAAMGDPAGINYSAPTTDLTAGTVSATISTVAGSTSGNVYFQVNIAPNLAVGVTAATSNTANATYTDSVSMVTTMNQPSNTVTYNVTQVASVSFNGSSTLSGAADGEGAGTTVVASASPGQTIQWTDYVWNTGNAADTFDIRFIDGTGTVVGNSATFTGANCSPTNMAANACTFPAGTTFTVFRSDGMTTLLDTSGNTTPDTAPIPLPSGGTCPSGFVINAGLTACGYPVVVRATIPPSATPGAGPFRVVLQASSTFNGAAVETVPNVLTTLVANTVDLTNNSALPTAMAAQGAGADDMMVKTTNTVTPAISSSTTTRFLLYVNNTGAVATVYDLSATYTSVPSMVGLVNPPVNWQVQFRFDGGAGDCSTVGGVTTSTGPTPVAPMGSRLICAEVIIPPTNQGGVGRPTDSPPGNYVIQYRVQQQGNAAVFDTKLDQVTLQNASNVTITPNGMQQTSPGGSVTYQHTLTNSGNVTETITFPGAFLVNNQTPTHSWTSAAYIDDGGNLVTPAPNGTLDVGTDTNVANATTFTMPPNTTRTVFVRVNAPAMAGSPANVTTITVTYNMGGSTVSATDTTTLTSGLRLDKYQQLTACGTMATPVVPAAPTFDGSGNAQAPWSSAPIAATANTAPGSCIAYLVVGTNTTANNINGITISDIIPNNTTFSQHCTPVPATTGPLFASVIPANGATGTIAAVSAATPAGPANAASILLPGGRVTLQFCVRIRDM